MQQVSENLIILSPGDQYQDAYENTLKIFLSGTQGQPREGLPWQQKFINGLTKLQGQKEELKNIKLVVINPFAPTNGEPSLDNPEFVQKTQWELEMMGRADVIFCNFLKKSKAPSAASGLLLFAQSGKIICRCNMDCIFYPKIKILSQTYGFPLLGDMDTTVTIIDTIINTIPKFKELSNFGV